MTSILAGPATHNQGPMAFPKTAMAKRPAFSSKKRGATALPSNTGARAFLMAGLHDPAATAGGAEQAFSNKLSEHASPSAGHAEMEGAEQLDGAQMVESAISLPEGHAYGQSSLQMLQTKQDREKRNAETFYETN